MAESPESGGYTPRPPESDHPTFEEEPKGPSWRQRAGEKVRKTKTAVKEKIEEKMKAQRDEATRIRREKERIPHLQQELTRDQLERERAEAEAHLARDASSVYAKNELVRITYYLGDFTRTQQLLSELRHNPDQPNAQSIRGLYAVSEAFASSDRGARYRLYEEATDAFDQALRADPYQPEANLFLTQPDKDLAEGLEGTDTQALTDANVRVKNVLSMAERFRAEIPNQIIRKKQMPWKIMWQKRIQHPRTRTAPPLAPRDPARPAFSPEGPIGWKPVPPDTEKPL
jgi:hypothetical protein